MNWKQINEKYPKAFLEWAKSTSSLNMDFILGIDQKEGETWFEIRYTNGIYTNIRTVHSCQIYAMPAYFDTLGIIIDPELYYATAVNKWAWAVNLFIDLKWIGYLLDITQQEASFPDRLSALKAGVEKTFEIREEQLNKL